MSCDNTTAEGCGDVTPTERTGTKISELKTLDPILSPSDLFVVVDSANNETKNTTYNTVMTYQNSGTSLSATTLPEAIVELDDDLTVHINNYDIHYPMSAIDGLVISGGNTNQVLAKVTSADYDYEWADPTGLIYGTSGQVMTTNDTADGYVWVNSDEIGVTVHSELDGLDNDDHQQYLTSSRGDARYYTQTQLDLEFTNYYTSAQTDVLLDAIDLQTVTDNGNTTDRSIEISTLSYGPWAFKSPGNSFWGTDDLGSIYIINDTDPGLSNNGSGIHLNKDSILLINGSSLADHSRLDLSETHIFMRKQSNINPNIRTELEMQDEVISLITYDSSNVAETSLVLNSTKAVFNKRVEGLDPVDNQDFVTKTYLESNTSNSPLTVTYKVNGVLSYPIAMPSNGSSDETIGFLVPDDGNNYSLTDITIKTGSSESSASTNATVRVAYPAIGSEYVLGGGTQLASESLMTTAIIEASAFNRHDSVTVTPVTLTANTTIFVDLISNDWIFDDVAIILTIGLS